jgi:hypothetical protein
MPSGKKTRRAFGITASIAIGGWTVLLLGWLWWTFQPANLPTIATPIPILNENNEIAIGEAIIMQLEIDKPNPTRTISSTRLIKCNSGNLVTLTEQPVKDLPTGSFSVVSDSVVLPAKITPGDLCVFTYRNTYEINPIRTETVEWTSETFTVLPPVQQHQGN